LDLGSIKASLLLVRKAQKLGGRFSQEPTNPGTHSRFGRKGIFKAGIGLEQGRGSLN